MGGRYEIEFDYCESRGYVYGWVGVFAMSTMPDGWKFVTIENCCEILDRYRIPVNSEEREGRIGEIPYYGANGLQGFIDSHIFDEPLILIAEDGGRFEEYATRPIAYRISGKSWVNNHAHVLRAKCDFDQDAIFYALEHKDIQHFIVGGTRAKLNQGALKAIQIQIADSKHEQSKIAEILSTVDQAIEQTEALIAKQQRIKTGLMQDLLTRGIDKHGQLRTEQTHAFKDSPLGRIPVEWAVAPLSSIADLQVGFAFKSSLFVDDGVRLMRGENVGAGRADWKDTKCLLIEDAKSYEAYILSRGDLIIGMDRTFTKSGCKVTELNSSDIPCLLVQRVGRFLSKGLPKTFVQLLIQSPYYQRALLLQQKGMDIPHLSKDEILSPLVATPSSRCEMVAIGDEAKKIDLNILDLEKAHKKLSLLKTALMQDLLTGRKRVTDLLEPAAA